MNKPKSPIRRERLHDQITRHIGLQILSGNTKNFENSLNTETELCRHLEVSRNIVRQAIKVLAAKGLVEVRPKVGIKVRPRSHWNLLDPDLLAWQCEAGADELFIRNLCEVRLAIEPTAAQFAALRASADEVASIRHWYHQMEINMEDAELWVSADMTFHSRIWAACHNDLLTQMNTTIGSALRATQDLVRHVPGGAAASLPYHAEVADGIGQHNPPVARKAMERLIKHAAMSLYEVLHLESFVGTHSPAKTEEEDQDSPSAIWPGN